MSDTVRRLRRARDAFRYVRVHRSGGGERLDGYVAGIGSKWFVLAAVDGGVRLDGFIAIRLRDVTKVAPVIASEAFHRAALQLRGDWPPPTAPASLRLGRTVELVADLAEHYPVVTLHIEYEDPEVCFIGSPTRYGKRTLDLLEISPDAEWSDEVTRWRYRDVSRVDVGGAYERALVEVGGTSPVPSPASVRPRLTVVGRSSSP